MQIPKRFIAIVLFVSAAIPSFADSCPQPKAMLENTSNQAWVTPSCVASIITYLDKNQNYRSYIPQLQNAQRFFREYYTDLSLDKKTYDQLSDMHNYILYRRGGYSTTTQCRDRKGNSNDCCRLKYQNPSSKQWVTQNLSTGKSIVDAYACRGLAPKPAYCLTSDSDQIERERQKAFTDVFAEPICLLRLAKFADETMPGSGYWNDLYVLSSGPIKKSFRRTGPYGQRVLKEIFPLVLSKLWDEEPEPESTAQEGSAGTGGEDDDEKWGLFHIPIFNETFHISPFKENMNFTAEGI